MSMNEYTYLVVTKMRVAELEARADEERLARVARQAARERRAAERATRRLQIAAGERRPGLLETLRSWFAPEGSVVDTADTTRQPAVSDRTAAAEAPTTGVPESADAEATELIKVGY